MDPITTTLRTVDGWYLCAEGGGGREVMANRVEAGPWEQWRMHTYDDGRWSFQSHDGHYLTAEIDGSVACRALESGEWERFTIQVREGAGVAFYNESQRKFLCAPGGGGDDPVTCDRPLEGQDPDTVPGAWEFFVSAVPFWETEAPGVVPVCARPLVGPLRVQDKLFADDSGFRRVFFCSWFPALRILRDDAAEFTRQLDAIVAAGFQGFRTFAAVGGWTDYWDGREVVPVTFTKWFFTGNHLRTDQYGDTIAAWPDYDDLLRVLLRSCRIRGLRLHIAVGDMQIITPDPNDELDLHRRLARICAEEGGLEVVALVGDCNEFPINHAGGDSDEAIDQLGKVAAIWESAIPGVITGIGAILSEEPDQLYRSVEYGRSCVTHTSRDPFAMCLKRTFGLVYWEGEYRHFSHPYWQSEPAGPGEDSYCRQDDPGNLVALYAMHALTGQASNWFQGAAVRSYEPLESEWGFQEIAHLLAAHLPEDVALWDHGSNQRGGIEYWWKGQDFRTAVFAEWDPSPPRPIASWTLYTGTEVRTGVGQPPAAMRHVAGYKAPTGTGLLVGKFA